MAKPSPDEDPRVTDLTRYRKAKAAAAKRPPPKPKAPRQSFLGDNPRAALILAILVVVALALFLGPRLL